MRRRRGGAGLLDLLARTLREEAADFRMEYDSDAGRFVLDMRHCPSRQMLETGKPCYAHYCEHCDTLYRRCWKHTGCITALTCPNARAPVAGSPLQTKRLPAYIPAESRTGFYRIPENDGI